MNIKFKIILAILMTTGFSAEFFEILFPEALVYDLERLHIFFFNLCCGSTILLFYTEAEDELSYKTRLFFLLSIIFTIAAFLTYYIISIIILLILVFITESVRIKRFSFFPFEFFKTNVSIAKKFHHASLLCLSIGLILSIPAIINEEYYKFFSLPMIKLNTFFLGFSFPLSLITFSLIFSFMKKTESTLILFLKNISFWAVNGGVIIFFLFILFHINKAQLIISIVLISAIITIFILFYIFSEVTQQKVLLISGLFFLLFTAGTGILYIGMNLLPEKYYEYFSGIQIIIKMHAFSALYGWNLTGLVIILRYNDFPLDSNLRIMITLHWLIIVVFAFGGYSFLIFAVLGMICFVVFLVIIFFSPRDEQKNYKR